MDQEYATLYRMTTLNNIHGFIGKVRNLEGKSIHNLTHSERKLGKYLKDLGML